MAENRQGQHSGERTHFQEWVANLTKGLTIMPLSPFVEEICQAGKDEIVEIYSPLRHR